MKKTTTRSKQQSVSIPPDVKKWLKSRIATTLRSMNGEILFILKQEQDRESST